MGYYVNLRASSVVLPAENLDEITQRWHEMNDKKYDDQKRGGSWSGGQQSAKWYSWMPEDYEKTTSTPGEILELLGFGYEDNGDLVITDYDSKTGQEDLFFKAIASLVPANQLMEWTGEDGATFAWYFDGKNMHELSLREAYKAQSKFEENKSNVESLENVKDSQDVQKPSSNAVNKSPKKGRYNL